MVYSVEEFQGLIRDIYHKKDSKRGVEKTFLWFLEEVGELASAIRKGELEQIKSEFADVFAWLSTLANLLEIDLEEVAWGKYKDGCPRCGQTPCSCEEPFK